MCTGTPICFTKDSKTGKSILNFVSERSRPKYLIVNGTVAVTNDTDVSCGEHHISEHAAILTQYFNSEIIVPQWKSSE